MGFVHFSLQECTRFFYLVSCPLAFGLCRVFALDSVLIYNPNVFLVLKCRKVFQEFYGQCGGCIWGYVNTNSFFFFLSFFLGPYLRHMEISIWSWVGAAAAGLHPSHSYAGSRPHLQPILQLAMSDPYPLSKARDPTYVLRDTMSGS